MTAATSTKDAEIERLREELSACTGGPGGCGYWREATGVARTELRRAELVIKAARVMWTCMSDDSCPMDDVADAEVEFETVLAQYVDSEAGG